MLAESPFLVSAGSGWLTPLVTEEETPAATVSEPPLVAVVLGLMELDERCSVRWSDEDDDDGANVPSDEDPRW